MKILPEFELGILNGWIPLGMYFLGLMLSILPYSQEARIWLFQNPVNRGRKILLFVRRIGQVSMVAYMLMMIFTPLSFYLPAFLPGALIFFSGWIMEISALYYFRRTPLGQPVVAGPYRISRNPQWVGLFLVLLGSAIAAGVWLYIAMVLAVGVIYHIQILDEEALCIQKFGDSFRAYMSRIPRYLLFF
jgi:protein-S-isoprenylcysteine O-methyltransferase Ste14